MPPSRPQPEPARAPGLGARLAAASREDAVRQRFVREVLARVPLERVVELHLFAPMRQGGVESGVAVVAARLGEAPMPNGPPSPEGWLGGPPPEGAPDHAPDHAPDRLTVYAASYRLTVRGPDRGRWQVDVREEADAPLVTVDAVVRGVQRRAGDENAALRLDAAAVAQLAAAA